MPKGYYKRTAWHNERTSKGHKGKHFSLEHRKKLSLKTKERDFGHFWVGKKRSKISCEKVSEANRGSKSHLWKGGISFEPYSVDWTRTLRRAIRERDHYICQICGELQGDIAFDVHHIDYDKKNCNPDNLATLCRRCHMKTNQNREYWLRYFSFWMLWKSI